MVDLIATLFFGGSVCSLLKDSPARKLLLRLKLGLSADVVRMHSGALTTIGSWVTVGYSRVESSCTGTISTGWKY